MTRSMTGSTQQIKFIRNIDLFNTSNKMDDFKEAIIKLDNLTSSFTLKNKRYLSLFRKEELKRKEIYVVLRVYNGDCMWM